MKIQINNPTATVVLTDISLTAQNASIGTTALLTAPAASLYRISYYLNVSQAATTSSSILLTLTWEDGTSTTQSFATPAIVKNTVGYFVSGEITVETDGTHDLSYATTYASTGATALNYTLRIGVQLV